MTDEELEKLKKKAQWSGFDRQEGSEIIVKLIAEIKRLKEEHKCEKESSA